MARREVNCIIKRPSHYDPHERIQEIGYKGTWRMAEDDAIKAIEGRTESFYVNVSGNAVVIIVATHKGRKYLKTENDGYAPNNLLNLTDC